MIGIGSEVEYTESGNGIDARIVGTVVEIQEAELLNVDTKERRPARRFVIKDRCGMLHTTTAMAETHEG